MKTILFFLCLLLVFNNACQNNKKMTDSQINTRVNNLINQMTLDEKLLMIGGYKEFSIMPIKRLGIPEMHMADGPIGVRNFGLSTAYPAGISLAATFNSELAKAYGQCIAKEAKAKNVQIMLGPALNIYRAPMCGRNFEYYGEDPFLTSRIAVNYINGMQGEGIIATAKHFACNNQEFDRNNVSSDLDERTLHEIYLPSFEASVKEAHVGAVMNSYNLVNGVHTSQSEYLLNTILKKEWDFKGFVMSDWGSTYNGLAAAKNGLDLEMPSSKFMNPDSLKKAINTGKLKIEVINDKIFRMLSTCMRFGLFDTISRQTPPIKDFSEINQVALQTALEGTVLLKNENNLLPLDKSKIKSIAVLGLNASPAVVGGGGSSAIDPYHSVSILEGIKKIAGKNIKVNFSGGPGEKVLPTFFQSNNFTTENDLPGLTGEYFANDNLEGKPNYTRVDRFINFSKPAQMAIGFNETNFSARWTGKLKIPQTGKYHIVVSGDDGYRLFINGKKVIDRWVEQGEYPSSLLIDLQANKENSIKLEYFQHGGGAAIRMSHELYKGDAALQAVNMAEQSDVTIVCIGFDSSVEGEGSDRPFSIPVEQINFIKQIHEVNKNVIIVLNAGGNAGIGTWIDDVGALLHAWYPGQDGGTAIAQLIFGLENPSGKLPISIEKRWEDAATFKSYYDNDKTKHVKYNEGIFLGYRHFDIKNIEPLYPFGYGLSYTTFEYSNLNISKNSLNNDGTVTITADIKNTGKITGKEIVQLYISELSSSVPRPLKELKSFIKISLQPGESKQISLCIDKMALSFYDIKMHNWKAEPGDYVISLGASSRDIRLKTTLKYK